MSAALAESSPKWGATRGGLSRSVRSQLLCDEGEGFLSLLLRAEQVIE